MRVSHNKVNKPVIKPTKDLSSIDERINTMSTEEIEALILELTKRKGTPVKKGGGKQTSSNKEMITHFYSCQICGSEWEIKHEVNIIVKGPREVNEWAGDLHLKPANCSKCREFLEGQSKEGLIELIFHYSNKERLERELWY